ncbi:MAG: hypothetical protein ACREQ7_13165 [Candidatus Binatia bacterium]
MTETELKNLLDSLVEENERDFVIVFIPRRTRRKHGSYRFDLRRIKVYEKALPDRIDLIATGLHELAHHLACLKKGDELMAILRDRKRFPSHGWLFKEMLTTLLDAFNSKYAEQFQGVLVLDRREPRYAPRFLPFDGDLKRSRSLWLLIKP